MTVTSYDALLRKSLYSFIEESFGVLHPGIEFLPNWHIELIAEYLQAATDRQIKRLIINIPPRYMKSTCISVAWPAWLLGNDPSRRILCASYAQSLSVKHSIDTRHLMNSDFYNTTFPKTKLDRFVNNKTKFLTTKRGFRFATSVGGTLTGEGGGFLILDDPHNAMQIHSNRYREKAIQWFQQSFVSRLDNKKEGIIIIVMQRLHPHDLTGYLLENQKSIWQHLNIPAIADQPRQYQVNNFNHLFKEGDILHPEREAKKEIDNISKELGCFAFNAQYLQSPALLDSGMVKASWFSYYEELPDKDQFHHIVQSWDTALKSGENNSYSVCTIWGKLGGVFFLIDVIRKKLEYPELKKEIIKQMKYWTPDHILIEDKASGQSLLQDLNQDYPYQSFIAIRPNKDKMTRFARVTPLFEKKKIMIAKEKPWRMEYEQELLSFPAVKSDDQVDSTSQYLNYVISSYRYAPRVR